MKFNGGRRTKGNGEEEKKEGYSEIMIESHIGRR
jgi:hypothetical protein